MRTVHNIQYDARGKDRANRPEDEKKELDLPCSCVRRASVGVLVLDTGVVLQAEATEALQALFPSSGTASLRCAREGMCYFAFLLLTYVSWQCNCYTPGPLKACVFAYHLLFSLCDNPIYRDAHFFAQTAKPWTRLDTPIAPPGASLRLSSLPTTVVHLAYHSTVVVL